MQSTPSKVEDEIVPLSGDPYFTCIVSRSNVEKPYQLFLPRTIQEFLPSATVPAVLFCRNKNWKIGYWGDHSRNRFYIYWRRFAIDNDLKIGDACLFELMDSKNLKFRVQILNGKLPPDFIRTADGQSSGTPIVIE